ncbi:hypothetical protein RHMOL_Rhmol02G0287300 [Rhododendron molle]|uniref:Uncharacterized protein n=1 Tax=Rhododendron molle TaxID=49168 RepID=A0ACC0PWK8_RHOML|nr:hypothetical protein RHMOL_Rhmol02G0287300 [Rhododendron molle]
MDITYYKGQFYAVTDWGGGNILICDVWGSDHPTIVEEKRVPNLGGLGRSLYIVESEGELLTIVRNGTVFIFDDGGEGVGKGVNLNDETRFGGTEEFRVYKVDLSNSAVAELQSLGDNTLFVGYNGSISVQASNSSKGIRPNCIYYADVCWISGTAFRLFSKGGRRVVDNLTNTEVEEKKERCEERGGKDLGYFILYMEIPDLILTKKFPDLKWERDNSGKITGGGGENIPEQEART